MSAYCNLGALAWLILPFFIINAAALVTFVHE